MTIKKLHILSVDLGRNIIFLESSSSGIAMIQGNERWGQDMFGSESILGGSYSVSYITGIRHILSDDMGLNIVQI